MLSAKGRDAEVNKGLAMGADLYVTKPFSTRDLMSRIGGLLDAAASEPRAAAVALRPADVAPQHARRRMQRHVSLV